MIIYSYRYIWHIDMSGKKAKKSKLLHLTERRKVKLALSYAFTKIVKLIHSQVSLICKTYMQAKR